MDECQHAMAELRNIVEGISKLRDTAYAHYSLLVEQVLKDQITDEQQLEQIMDGLCDFCDEIRFMVQHRSVASTRKWRTQTPLSVYCARTRYLLQRT